jgi:hypothetical protein
MRNYDWTQTFHLLWDKAVAAYRAGNRSPATYFSVDETSDLAGIGCSLQELYDYAEDWCGGEQLAFDTALLITAARRDFFLVVQKGKPTGHVLAMDQFPAKTAELAGFAWLPRIICKARGKLRGELPAELMYCCGGDRAFLQKVNIHPADFLREVWAARDDDQMIVDYVQQCSCQSL